MVKGIRPFEGTVIDETGFKVVFSNSGQKLHPNPNPVNYEKKIVKCAHPSCDETGKFMYHVCSKHRNELFHIADWVGLLRLDEDVIEKSIKRSHHLDAPLLNAYAPAHAATTEYLVLWMGNNNAKKKLVDKFIDATLHTVAGKIPDATTLQLNYESDSRIRPTKIIKELAEVVQNLFPNTEFAEKIIKSVRLKIKGKVFILNIPIRIIAALLITGFACEESNRGDLWFRIANNVKPEKQRRAGAYMSVVYYLLRRHSNATTRQAKISLRM
jgi:hypothetical protein